jgi:hypothetical protein
MKKKHHGLYIVGAALCFAAQVSAAEFLNAQPYGGFDLQWRRQPFQQGLGKNLFKKNVPQDNVYLGIQFFDSFGLEGGYESSFSKSKLVTIPPGGNELGFTIPSIPPNYEQHSFKSKLYGWHISMIGFTPYVLENQKMRFFAAVGLSNKRVKLIDQSLALNGTPLDQTIIDASTRTLQKRKCLARLSGGVQYLINPTVGVRGIAVWENAQQFKNLKSLENPTGDTTASLRNSVSLGLGIFANF